MDAYYVQNFRPATMECILQSAIKRNVPANVLLAIGELEAGREGSAIPNKNGTYDLGRAGINTVHLAELERAGVARQKAAYFLMFDGCYSYEFAAYLLSGHIKACTGEFWNCIANYHSKTAQKNMIYQAKLKPLAIKWERYLSTQYSTRGFDKK